MSLINQMLQDLEQRGAGSTHADKMITNSLNAHKTPTVTAPQFSQTYHAKHGVPYLKISGLILLLLGGTYLWMQSAPALSQSIGQLKALSFANKPQEPLSNLTPAVSPAPQPTLASDQVNRIQPTPLFENTLKYTPTEAQTNKLLIKAQSNVAKTDEKNTLIATVMPAEQLTTTQPIANKIADSANVVTVNAPTVTDFKNSTEKVVLSTKANAHGNSHNIGKQISAEQKSANAYRQALSNLQQGRIAEAQSQLNQALEASPSNQEARQTLAGLLLDNNRKEDAKTTLAAGLAITPEQTSFRMALARLQVELGDKSGALYSLEQGLPYANNNAEYQSFLAALLQRTNRHEEAVSHYNTALSINAGSANTFVGLGISLQALGKLESAQEAYNKALATATLNQEVSQFIDQQLKLINYQLQN